MDGEWNGGVEDGDSIGGSSRTYRKSRKDQDFRPYAYGRITQKGDPMGESGIVILWEDQDGCMGWRGTGWEMGTWLPRIPILKALA